MNDQIIIIIVIVGLITLSSLTVAVLSLIRLLKKSRVRFVLLLVFSFVFPLILIGLGGIGIYSSIKSVNYVNMKNDEMLKKSQNLLKGFDMTQHAVTIKIGKFKYQPDESLSDEGYVDNKGEVPVTFKNSGKFDIYVDTTIVAYDEDGTEITYKGIGTGFKVKAGKTKTYVFFNGMFSTDTMEKLRKATFKENKADRITTKASDIDNIK